MKRDPPSQAAKTINFKTAAAIDYFGPPEMNVAEQQRVVDTFYRATQTYRGISWSDWWYDRKVNVSCNMKSYGDDCGTDGIAFTVTEGDERYPLIVYCDSFFTDS